MLTQCTVFLGLTKARCKIFDRPSNLTWTRECEYGPAYCYPGFGSFGAVRACTYCTCWILMTIFQNRLHFCRVLYAATRSNILWLVTAGILMITTTAGGGGVFYVCWNLMHGGLADPHSPRGRKITALYLLGLGSMAVSRCIFSVKPSLPNPLHLKLFDLLVSLVLCRLFFSSKRKTTFGNTQTLLTCLLVTTLETFSLTAAPCKSRSGYDCYDGISFLISECLALTTVILTLLPLPLTGMAGWRANIVNLVDLTSKKGAWLKMWTFQSREHI